MSAKLWDLSIERRDRILNAALKEFVLQGYENASTNVIAEEAGFSKSLMFHYVGSKKELFFFVYDYFSNLMKKEYFELMDYEEKDIFKRLRQSYLLQINLVKRYPYILELKKFEQSAVLNEKSDKKREGLPNDCYKKIFSGIDLTKFRKELNIEKSKEIILWANIGFINKIINEILSYKNSDHLVSFNTKIIIMRLDEYFNELRKLFYMDEKNE